MNRPKKTTGIAYEPPRDILLLGGPGAGKVVRAYPYSRTYNWCVNEVNNLYDIQLLLGSDGTRYYVATLGGAQPLEELINHYKKGITP